MLALYHENDDTDQSISVVWPAQANILHVSFFCQRNLDVWLISQIYSVHSFQNLEPGEKVQICIMDEKIDMSCHYSIHPITSKGSNHQRRHGEICTLFYFLLFTTDGRSV